ncbi:porin, partial [Salmonella sp. NW805]
MNQLKAMASGAVLLLTAVPLTSYALTFDARGGYRSGSHAYETR